MELPNPSLEEYRRLYEAAMVFKKAAPWEWMFEDEIFGVRNPETGQIAYVSIMGTSGEHLAMALYLGSEGLDGFWCMHRGEGLQDPHFLLEIPQLQASFEDRDMLDAKDRKVIKSLGLKFRGRMAWPLFRSYVPGCMPWFVTPDEARFLAVALEQVLDVTGRLHDDHDLLEAPEEDQYLVRVQTEEGWADEWLAPEPITPRPPPQVDTKRLAAIRQELPRKKFTLEGDLFVMPSIIQEEEDPRPLLPYLLMVVEAESGMVLGNVLAVARPSLDEVWAKAQTGFLDTIARLQAIPHQIVVRDERLLNLLVPIAAGLGIQLVGSHRLPMLDEARAAFEDWMG